MPVEFLCPGCEKKITCSEDKIGQPGKCPKCGTKFQVPDPNEPDDDEEQAVGDHEIVFLCPNGHKLNGPSHLQGKPGKCPHCGVKFVIPNYEDDDEEEPPSEEGDDFASVQIPTDAPSALDDLAPLADLGGFNSLPDLDSAIGQPAVRVAPGSGIDAAPAIRMPQSDGDSVSMEIGAHPMAQMFEKFWSKSSGSAFVEVYMKSGAKIRPDHYASATANQEQGVFAVKNPDGTYALTAVAWESVERIIVCGVSELPRDIFRG